MLKIKDFVPHSNKPAGIFSMRTYESFNAAVAEAGEWLKSSGVKLVQMETVLVPNPKPNESTEEHTKFHTSHSSDSYWIQFVRVWYDE